MSSGLDNVMKPIEIGKEDWVEYDGIMMPKNTARAKKAWVTMRAKQEKKKYGNRKNKIEILNLIKEHIEKEGKYHNDIISLETMEYNLPNLLDKEHNHFFIAQTDKKEYLKMLNTKPENVEFLHYGCISELKYLKIKPDYIYFDFCKTFSKCEDIFYELKGKINQSYKIFLTTCLRNINKKVDDYKFDYANKLHKVFPSFEIVEAIPYRDKNHAPMIFFILVNLQHCSLDIHNRYSYTKIYEWKLLEWIKDQLEKDYPDIYKLLDEEEYHRWWGIKIDSQDLRKILYKLFNKAIDKKRLVIPEYNTNDERLISQRLDCLEDFFIYFENIVTDNLGRVWKKPCS